MLRHVSDSIPFGQFRLDCDFTIGKVLDIQGSPIFGVIWYAGGAAWAWREEGAALCHARDLAERQELRRQSGRTRAGLRAV